MAVTTSKLWLSTSAFFLPGMDTKQVTDQHRSEGHALSDKTLEGVANEVIKAHWGEPHVAFGVSRQLFYMSLSKHRGSREKRDGGKQKPQAQNQHPQKQRIRTAEHNTARKLKATDPWASPAQSTASHLLSPAQLLQNPSKANTALPVADSTEQKPTPRNKLDLRAHHVTQPTVLKSKILNGIINDPTDPHIGLKPKPSNSWL